MAGLSILDLFSFCFRGLFEVAALMEPAIRQSRWCCLSLTKRSRREWAASGAFVVNALVPGVLRRT